MADNAGKIFDPRRLPVIAAAIFTIIAIGSAFAQKTPAPTGPNEVAAGKTLAQRLCVNCHVIEPTGQRGWTDAPDFSAIASRKGVTAAGLSTTIQKPHTHMLNDQQPKAEADAMAAYIVSLRRR